jgi:hypothetical protein
MAGDLKRVVRPATTLLVSVVGVVVFDWRVRSVPVFYWLEVGVTVVRRSIEAALAGRPTPGLFTTRSMGVGSSESHAGCHIVVTCGRKSPGCPAIS